MVLLRQHQRLLGYLLGIMLCSCVTHAITFRNPDGSEAQFSEDYIKNTLFEHLLTTPMFLETLKIEAKNDIQDFITAELQKTQAENNSLMQHNYKMLDNTLRNKSRKSLAFLYPKNFPHFNVQERNEEKANIQRLSANILRIIDEHAVDDNPILKQKLKDIFYDYCLYTYQALQAPQQKAQDHKRDQGFEWLVAGHNLTDVLYLSIRLTPEPDPSRYGYLPVIHGKDIRYQEFDIITDRYIIESKYTLGNNQNTWYKILEQASREFAWVLVCSALNHINQFTVPKLKQQNTQYRLTIPYPLARDRTQHITTNLITRYNSQAPSTEWHDLISHMATKPLCIYTQYDEHARQFCKELETGIHIISGKDAFIRGLQVQLRFINHNAVYHVWYDSSSAHVYGKHIA